MQQPRLTSDTPAWLFQTWAAFILAFGSTALGILWLDVGLWPRMFLGLGFLFTVSSCFSLAKTLRDRHESEKITSRIEEAKTEQVLRDYVREAA